ncbi:MAG: type I methionyl aminopeptidase [Candidatus Falkowbacteria bacterium]|nr:type I methionyl aminopeptidase [Candidatus Falkowbacteria bacterium]
MINLKSLEEIEVIRRGGQILANILQRLIKEVRPGVSTEYLENIAAEMMAAAGGRPAFKNYDMGDGIFFPSILCISINEEVVHGSSLPARILRDGDIVDIDLGMEWPTDLKLRQELKIPINPWSENGGYFTDMCQTVAVGKISRGARKLLKVTAACLVAGIKQVKPGNSLNDIGRAVQTLAEAHGYGVVRDLVGHGVGHYSHEEPNVFNYEIKPNSRENLILKPGLVIAIEPMINLGDWRVKIAANKFTIITADHSLSAHFEHTVAVTDSGYKILTAL